MQSEWNVPVAPLIPRRLTHVTGKGEDTSTPSFEGTWMTQPHQQLDEFHRHVEQPMKNSSALVATGSEGSERPCPLRYAGRSRTVYASGNKSQVSTVTETVQHKVPTESLSQQVGRGMEVTRSVATTTVHEDAKVEVLERHPRFRPRGCGRNSTRLNSTTAQYQTNEARSASGRAGALISCHPGHGITPVRPGRTRTVHWCPKGEAVGRCDVHMLFVRALSASSNGARLEIRKNDSSARLPRCVQIETLRLLCVLLFMFSETR